MTRVRTFALAACLLAPSAALGAQDINPPAVAASPPTPRPAAPGIPSDMKFKVSVPAVSNDEIEKLCCEFVKGSVNVPVVGDVRFELWRRKPMDELRFHEDTFSASALVYYFVDAGNIAQCGWDDEEARRVVVGLDSKVKWGLQWTLQSHTVPRPVVVEDRYRCRLTRRDFDATDRLTALASEQIQRLAQRFDQLVKEKSNYRARAAAAWRDLQRPVPLGDGQWMLLNPTVVSAGPIVFGNTVDSEFSVTTQPVLVVGAEPAAPTTPLPDLVVVPDPQGIHVTADLTLRYSDINAELHRSPIIGSTFTVGRRQIEVKDVRVYGSGDEVALEVGVIGKVLPPEKPQHHDPFSLIAAGFRNMRYQVEKTCYDVNAKLYLRGRVQYVAEQKTIVLRDVEYDSATRDVLNTSQRGRWLLQAPLAGSISTGARFEFGSRLEGSKGLLRAAIDRVVNEFTTLRGTVESVTVNDLFLQNDGITARVTIDGSAELVVAWQ